MCSGIAALQNNSILDKTRQQKQNIWQNHISPTRAWGRAVLCLVGVPWMSMITRHPGRWFNINMSSYSIGNPIVEIRRSSDRLISTMGFPMLVRYPVPSPHSVRTWPRGGHRQRYFRSFPPPHGVPGQRRSCRGQHRWTVPRTGGCGKNI